MLAPAREGGYCAGHRRLRAMIEGPAMTKTATEFLASRRSHPRPALKDPAPEGERLEALLTAALRVPDHGRVQPWRLVLIDRAAQARLGPQLREAALRLGREEKDADKALKSWDSPLIVAVVFSPAEHPKVPRWEQHLSAGAVCLSLVNAALADGWGATWLTGPAALDRHFMEGALGLAAHEEIAGFIHLGTGGETPPERPRPDLAGKLTRL